MESGRFQVRFPTRKSHPTLGLSWYINLFSDFVLAIYIAITYFTYDVYGLSWLSNFRTIYLSLRSVLIIWYGFKNFMTHFNSTPNCVLLIANKSFSWWLLFLTPIMCLFIFFLHFNYIFLRFLSQFISISLKYFFSLAFKYFSSFAILSQSYMSTK